MPVARTATLQSAGPTGSASRAISRGREAATQAAPADLPEVEFRAFAGAPYYLELSHEGRRFRMKEQARKSNGHLKPREEHD
jgi:hypothetical protein